MKAYLKRGKAVLPIVLIAILLVAACFLAACSEKRTEADYEYEYEYKQPFVDACDEGMTIDGQRSEAVWQGKKYYSNTLYGITMTATTAFSDTGLYVAGEVDDPDIYWKTDFNFRTNSTIGFYIIATDRDAVRDLGVKNVRLNAKRVRSDTLTRVNAATVVLGGELNSGESDGMAYEFYIRWKELGVAEKPEKVYLLMEYNHMSSINDSNGQVIRSYPWDRWDTPSAYFEFDENGYAQADAPDAVLGDSATGISKTSAWRETEEGDFESVLGGSSLQHRLFVKDAYTTDYSLECVLIPQTGFLNDATPSFGLMSFNDSEFFNYIRITMAEEDLTRNRLRVSIVNNYGQPWNDLPVWNDYGEYEYPEPRDFKTQGVKVKVIKSSEKFYYFVNGALVYSEKFALHDGKVYAGVWEMNAGIRVTDVKFTDYAESVGDLQAEINGMGYVCIDTAEYVAGGSIEGPIVAATGSTVDFTLTIDAGYRLSYVKDGDRDITDAVRATLQNGKFTLQVDKNMQIDYAFERLVPGETATELHGTVVDDTDGNGLAGTTLVIASSDESKTELFYEVVASATGEFSVLLPNGEYTLTASVDKYNAYRQTISLPSEGGEDLELRLTRASFGWNVGNDDTFGGQSGNWSFEGEEQTTSATVSDVRSSAYPYTYLNDGKAESDFLLQYTISAVDILSSGDSAPCVAMSMTADGKGMVSVGIVFTPTDPKNVRFRLTAYGISGAGAQYYVKWNSYYDLAKDVTAGDEIAVTLIRKVHGAGDVGYDLYLDGVRMAYWNPTAAWGSGAETPPAVGDRRYLDGSVWVGLLTQGASATYSDIVLKTDASDILAYEYAHKTLSMANKVTLADGTEVNGAGSWQLAGNKAVSAAASNNATRWVFVDGETVTPTTEFTLSTTLKDISTVGSTPGISFLIYDGTKRIDIGIVFDKTTENKLRFRLRHNSGGATYYVNWDHYEDVGRDITADADGTEVMLVRRANGSDGMIYALYLDGVKWAEWDAGTLDKKYTDMGAEAAIGFFVDNAGATFDNVRFINSPLVPSGSQIDAASQSSGKPLTAAIAPAVLPVTPTVAAGVKPAIGDCASICHEGPTGARSSVGNPVARESAAFRQVRR